MKLTTYAGKTCHARQDAFVARSPTSNRPIGRWAKGQNVLESVRVRILCAINRVASLQVAKETYYSKYLPSPTIFFNSFDFYLLHSRETNMFRTSSSNPKKTIPCLATLNRIQRIAPRVENHWPNGSCHASAIVSPVSIISLAFASLRPWIRVFLCSPCEHDYPAPETSRDTPPSQRFPAGRDTIVATRRALLLL